MPFDPRPVERMAPAVARAAMEDGVALNPVKDQKGYHRHPGERLTGTH